MKSKLLVIYGGIEEKKQQFINEVLLSKLSKFNVKIYYTYGSTANSSESEDSNLINPFQVKKYSKLISPLMFIVNCFYLFFYLKKNAVQTIFVRNAPVISLVLNIFYSSRICSIYQYTFPDHIESRQNHSYTKHKLNKIKFWFSKVAMNHSDLVLPVSQMMSLYLKKSGVKNSMIPISLSANSQLLSNTSYSFKINSKKLTLLYIGSFAKSRGLEILVDVALELVKSDYKEIRFNLIGFENQKELAYWNKLLEDKDISCFFNLKLKVPREKLLSHFESADIGICPLPIELLYYVSSPTKIYEYLSFGLPIISSKIPDIEIKNRSHKFGLLVDHDVNAYTEAIKYFYDNPKVLRQMSLQASEFINNTYNNSILGKFIEELIVKVRNEKFK